MVWASRVRSDDLIGLSSTEKVRGHVSFCGSWFCSHNMQPAGELYVPRKEHQSTSALLAYIRLQRPGGGFLHPWGHNNVVLFYSGVSSLMISWYRRMTSETRENEGGERGGKKLGWVFLHVGERWCAPCVQYDRGSIPIKRSTLVRSWISSC